MEARGFVLSYYNGEEKNPFVGIDENSRLWWDGEKVFYDLAVRDGGGEQFINNLEEWFDKSLKEGDLTGRLVDTKIPQKTRLLIFFLDLWHGKWFPYDSFDVIDCYEPAASAM